MDAACLDAGSPAAAEELLGGVPAAGAHRNALFHEWVDENVRGSWWAYGRRQSELVKRCAEGRERLDQRLPAWADHDDCLSLFGFGSGCEREANANNDSGDST